MRLEFCTVQQCILVLPHRRLNFFSDWKLWMFACALFAEKSSSLAWINFTNLDSSSCPTRNLIFCLLQLKSHSMSLEQIIKRLPWSSLLVLSSLVIFHNQILVSLRSMVLFILSLLKRIHPWIFTYFKQRKISTLEVAQMLYSPGMSNFYSLSLIFSSTWNGSSPLGCNFDLLWVWKCSFFHMCPNPITWFKCNMPPFFISMRSIMLILLNLVIHFLMDWSYQLSLILTI